MRLLTLYIGVTFCCAVLCRAETIHLNFSDAPGTFGFTNADDREISHAELVTPDFTGLTNTSWARIGGAESLISPGVSSSDDAIVGGNDPDFSAGSSANAIGTAPEPITVAMVGGGLILLGMMRPRRRNR